MRETPHVFKSRFLSSKRHVVLAGFVASVVLSVVSLVRGWPFPSLSAAPWIAQWSAPHTVARYGALSVYLIALGVLSFAWLRVMSFARANELSVGDSWKIFALWAAPLLLSTPLCSGDVYVYVVDGHAIARGFSVYTEGVSAMGQSPMVNMVHPLWRDTNTMYGPTFLRLSQLIVELTPNSVVGSVMLFRAVAVASVVITGLSLGSIARRCHRSVPEGLALALLNPITLVHLVSGAHNDATMVAFVALGLALGVRAFDRSVTSLAMAGLALASCSVAGAFKLPGFAGALVLGWMWAGRYASFLQRVVVVAISGTVTLAMFALQTWALGMDWGWMNASKVPGVAHPLLAPANAIGIAIGGPIGLASPFNTAVRSLATVVAVAVATLLIVRTHRDATPERVIRGFGFALLAIAWLGPAVYPWYFAWGTAIAGAMGVGIMQRVLERVTVVVMFAVLPGGFGVLDVLHGSARIVIAWIVSIVMIMATMKVMKATAFVGMVRSRMRDKWRAESRHRLVQHSS